MLKITFRLYGPFQDTLGRRVKFDVPEGTTVTDAVRSLCVEYPSLEQSMLTADDEIADSLTIMYNDTHLRQLDTNDRELTDGDIIQITNPIVGGSE